jgi:hypothetical protein
MQSQSTAHELFGVPAARLAGVEQEVRWWLGQVPLGDLGEDDVIRFLRQGVLQLWATPGMRGILITEILHHPKHSILLLRYGVGKLPDNAKDLLSQVVIPWAKSYGCRKIEVAGRPGWKRVLGLTERIIVMRGDI